MPQNLHKGAASELYRDVTPLYCGVGEGEGLEKEGLVGCKACSLLYTGLFEILEATEVPLKGPSLIELLEVELPWSLLLPV